MSSTATIANPATSTADVVSTAAAATITVSPRFVQRVRRAMLVDWMSDVTQVATSAQPLVNFRAIALLDACIDAGVALTQLTAAGALALAAKLDGTFMTSALVNALPRFMGGAATLPQVLSAETAVLHVALASRPTADGELPTQPLVSVTPGQAVASVLRTVAAAEGANAVDSADAGLALCVAEAWLTGHTTPRKRRDLLGLAVASVFYARWHRMTLQLQRSQRQAGGDAAVDGATTDMSVVWPIAVATAIGVSTTAAHCIAKRVTEQVTERAWLCAAAVPRSQSLAEGIPIVAVTTDTVTVMCGTTAVLRKYGLAVCGSVAVAPPVARRLVLVSAMETTPAVTALGGASARETAHAALALLSGARLSPPMSEQPVPRPASPLPVPVLVQGRSTHV